MANSPNTNSTLFRGMNIMHEVAQSQRGLTVVELVDVVGLPKPTVHRIATQLESEGYLQRNPVDKRFLIGNALKEFSLSILANSSVGAPRHAILEALADEVGETCNCTMLDGNHTVYFDRVECNWPIKINLHPGSRLPLHATASGKLFLAHMAARDRRRLLQAAPLSQNTPKTLVDPDALEQEFRQIREDGVSYDNEELFTGMVAVAVPVFDTKKHICFTVAVHAPTSRQQLEDLRQHIPALRKAADALSDSYCHLE
ncbi:MAG: IclR family transcriptional regulator [Thiolinea sp.]